MALSTLASGAKLRASFLNLIVAAVNSIQAWIDVRDAVQQTGSTSASSAIGTSATSILSISNCLFKNGRAYSVEVVGGVFGSTTNEADFSIWKNGTSGTQIGATYRTPCVASLQRNCYGKTYFRNVSGADVTFTTLNVAVAASTGTVTQDAASNRPRMLLVRDVGLGSQYSNAFSIT